MIEVSRGRRRALWLCCGPCMPSLLKMPVAARHLISNVFYFLHGSSTSERASDKVFKPFSTPQVERKTNSVECARKMSCSHEIKSVNGTSVDQWIPNPRERELLRRTWSDEFKFLYDLGSSIYIYIFEHNPQCKQLFPSIAKYGDNWKDSREFRVQALRFVQTISQVVKNIYHMERLESYLYGIGQLHCKYAYRGFKPEYWEDFKDAMEHSLTEHMNTLPDLDAQERSEAALVWRQVARYIIAHMKTGYFDGMKSINNHPPLT